MIRYGQAGWCRARSSRTGDVMMVMAVSPGTTPAATRAAVTSARPAAIRATDEWLTTVLRPAGPLDGPMRHRLLEALSHLAASCDMAVVDLTATDVAAPHALARGLRAPALEFERAGRCLLLVGASSGLVAELDRAAVPVATLAAGRPD